MPPRIWAIHDTQGFGSTRPSGCGFYRVLIPFDQLKAHGWHAGYGLMLPEDDFGDVDIVVGQRLHVPILGPMWEALGRCGVRRVYEIDDDPFSIDPVNWLARGAYTNQEVLDSIRRFAASADLVTVTTEPLAEVFRAFNRNVAVIPNRIPAEMLEIERPVHPRLTIGWTGGASHGRDLALIAQVWRDAVDQTGARGHFVGVDFRNMTRHEGFDFTPWEPDPRDYYRRLDFDIGLIPLAETPFSRSKSAIKAMEYAALGIPAVVSDHPVYRDYILDGVTGFLCSSAAQWRDAIMQLAADEDLRESMGAKARELAASWTAERCWRSWARPYRNLAEGGEHGERGER